jgi:hypothetical protein
MSTPTSNVKKYNAERLMTVLLAPVISEKATFIADKHSQVIFRVAPDATKPEVKAAVELMWKVEVDTSHEHGEPPPDAPAPGETYPLQGRSLVLLRQTSADGS